MQTTVLNKKNIKEEKTSLNKKMIFEKRLKTKRLKTKLKGKKDPTIRLQKMLDDPKNTSYWPFNNVEDFLKHLHSNKNN